MKVASYESETFMQEMEATWQGLKPLYEEVQNFHDMTYIIYIDI